jgi:hypothetical protein
VHWLRPRLRAGPSAARFRLTRERHVRIDHHFAGVAVDEHRRTRRHAATDITQSDNGGDTKRAGEDRGVVGPAAGVSGKPANHLPIELRDDRRCEFVRDQHARRIQVAQ